ncbi:hypothetical protein LSH36_471g06000 [Paralvinella palmiformis]|uniref:HAT C-terminal dimerisation domain-containing protein n=1 Tax=Paralvinella palmiformis TaxID=53620 RepID=A0AAD9MZ41_9ANNE|nr:hypothetical protein LSH36_471g06000 [Paralvinella palmiformis]
MEQYIIFVRTCESGQVKVRFLSIENTPKPDAVGVTASIKRGFESELSIAFADFFPKFVAIATDGAVVMTGHKAGVVSNLKKDQPALFGVHCFAHRLELACHDVVKSHPSYQELDKFFLDLYLFYHNSNLNRANLNEACLAAGSKVLVQTRVGGTQLAKLSLSLQSRTCSVADRLQATISVLKLHTEQPGPKLQRVFGQNELCGVKLKENARRLAYKREDMAGVTDKLVKRLDTRLDVDDSVVAATSIANFSSWPDTQKDARGFGDEHVRTLVRHFTNILAAANVDVESITPLCYRRHGDNLHTVSWQAINRQFAHLAGNMLALIDVVLCIPATSVEAERGFSVMKRVKTDFRNRLKNPALQDLLQIILLSPLEAEFEPKKAIDHWYNTLDRRESGQRSIEVVDLEDGIDDCADLNDLLHSTAVL